MPPCWELGMRSIITSSGVNPDPVTTSSVLVLSITMVAPGSKLTGPGGPIRPLSPGGPASPTGPTGPTGAQGTSGTAVVQAWVNFNGTTSPGTIRTSFNVSSVTKNTTGDYTVNFTNAMSDTNYCTIGFQGDGTTGGPIPYLLGFSLGAYNQTVSITTSGVRVYSRTSGGGVYDAIYNCVSVFR